MRSGAQRPGGRTARTRAAVHGAVLGLLREEGPAGLSFDRVARRAGVHRTTVHRRWSSRAALLADALIANSAAQVPVPDTGTFATDLRLFARAVRDAIAAAAGRGVLSALLDPGLAGELAEVNARFWAARFAATRVMVARAQQRGEVPRELDPRFVIELVGGPIWFRMFVVGAVVDDAFLDGVVDAALRGISR